MTPEYLKTTLIVPVVMIVLGFFVGVLAERIFMAGLRRAAARTKWQGDKALSAGLRGVIVLLFLLGGFYLALLSVDLDPGSRLLKLGQNAIASGVVLILTVAMSRIIGGFIGLYAAGIPGIQPSTSIFIHIAKAVIYVIGLLVILQTFGVSITPILTALGVGGLGIALALRDTISNLFSGLHLAASNQVRVGDFIRLDTGHEGYVDDINWRNTTIRSPLDNILIVPNEKLTSTVVTNFSRPGSHVSFDVGAGVKYRADTSRVEQIALEAAETTMKEVAGGPAGFRPRFRYIALGEKGIEFRVTLSAAGFAQQDLVKHEFIKRLYERFRNEDIEIG